MGKQRKTWSLDQKQVVVKNLLGEKTLELDILKKWSSL